MIKIDKHTKNINVPVHQRIVYFWFQSESMITDSQFVLNPKW